MSKTREKKRLVTEVISREMAEDYFASFAKADARKQQLQAKMDQEIIRIREKYQDEIASLDEERAAKFELLQHFATQNPEFFTKKKSLEMAHGVLGFRTGTPSLKTLKGFTWPAVTNIVKNVLPDFVRTKEEVDKESLLAERDNPDISKHFPTIGVKVEQSETFFVEPKKEE